MAAVNGQPAAVLYFVDTGVYHCFVCEKKATESSKACEHILACQLRRIARREERRDSSDEERHKLNETIRNIEKIHGLKEGHLGDAKDMKKTPDGNWVSKRWNND